MHNLHLIVVRADNGRHACLRAEKCISDYGGENNYSDMCGAVSENDTVYQSGQGRYIPEKPFTIDNINALVNNWTGFNNLSDNIGRAALREAQQLEDLSHSDLLSLKSYLEKLISIKGYRETREQSRKGEGNKYGFNILDNDEYNSSCFDESGVTSFTDSYTETDGILWVVFCDIHS